MELLAVASVLGYALILNKTFNWKASASLLPVICAIICLLFAAGLAGILGSAAKILLAAGLIFFVVILPDLGKKRAEPISHDRGLFFFIAASIGLYLLTRLDFYSQLHANDDFSHWARASKVMHLNNRLLVAADPIYFKDYPPGTGLLDYFFSHVLAITPNSMLFAHAVLVLAAVAGILGVASNDRGKPSSFPWSIMCFSTLVLSAFSLGFHSLGADLLIATLMGASVAMYWQSDRSWSAVLRLFPVIMALPLLKSVGVMLGAIAVVAILADQCLLCIRQRRVSRILLLSILLVPALLFSNSLWSHQKKNTQAPASFTPPPLSAVIFKGLSPSTATTHQKIVMRNFSGEFSPALFGDRLFRPAFWAIVFLALIAIAVAKAESRPESRRELTVTLSVWFGGLVIYVASLLVLYVFIFNTAEGPRLASFGRYLSIYLLGLSIFLFTVLLEQRETAAPSAQLRRPEILCVGLFCVMASFYKSGFLFLVPLFAAWWAVSNRIFELAPHRQTGVMWTIFVAVYGLSAGFGIHRYISDMKRPTLLGVFKDIQTTKRFVPAGKRVYFIFQGDDNYRVLFFNDGILPLATNGSCYAVKAHDESSDEWTCQLSAMKFAATLKSYDYLMVSHTDSAFRETFGSLFAQTDIPDGTLYRIVKDQPLSKLEVVSYR